MQREEGLGDGDEMDGVGFFWVVLFVEVGGFLLYIHYLVCLFVIIVIITI